MINENQPAHPVIPSQPPPINPNPSPAAKIDQEIAREAARKIVPRWYHPEHDAAARDAERIILSAITKSREQNDLGSPDAASNHVGHVLQNALKEALPLLEIVRDYEPGAPDGACAPNRARVLCEHIEELLSEHRDSSPAASVSSENPAESRGVQQEDTVRLEERDLCLPGGV